MTQPLLSRADLTLVIVGDGKERESLLKLKETLGLNGRVQFVGKQDRLEIFYRAADLFVQTSSREALSLAVLEAMASELPVVVSEAGDHPRLIRSGENGFLVPVEDVGALTEKITFVLNHPEQARRIGRSARETIVSQYSKEKMIRATESLYEELLTHA